MQITSTPQMSSAAAKKPKATASKEETGAPEPKDWTVLMYIAGDNDLEPYASKMMLDLEDKCGTNEHVNVVCQLGRMSQPNLKKLYESQGRKYEPTNIDGDWGGIRRYLVTQNDKPREGEAANTIQSKLIGKTDDKQMSDATTLADFLVMGMKKYPAKHTMVVLADHGGGFLGAFTSDANASGSSIMKPAAIASAFKIAETATGEKPEVVDMVACLMGSTEVAHQMKDRAKYLLASEEIGTTASFDYGPIIAGISEASEKGKSIGPKALARSIVHAYDDNPDAFKTKAAVDLPKMQAVTDSFKELVDTLKATKTEPQAIAGAIRASQNFGITERAIYPFYDQIHDLRGFAEHLAGSPDISDKNLKKAAKAVMEAVDASVVDNLAHKYQRMEVIGEGKTHDNKESFTEYRVYEGKYEASGLSVFAPLSEKYLKSPKMAEYRELDFSKETGWADYVTDLNAKLAAGAKKEEQGHTVARPADPDKVLPFNLKSYSAASSLDEPAVKVEHPEPMSAAEACSFDSGNVFSL